MCAKARGDYSNLKYVAEPRDELWPRICTAEISGEAAREFCHGIMALYSIARR